MFRRKQRNKKVKDASPGNRNSLDVSSKIPIQREVGSNTSLNRGRSVSMDMCHFGSQCTSELKDFPTDVRKSLVVLDKVLQDFEDDHKKASRRHSAPVLRNLLEKFRLKKTKDRDVPSPVGKSVEALDKVVRSTEEDVVRVPLRNKRSKSVTSFTPKCNEDVRRSLEILDNVLAEFDDHDIFSSPSDSTDILVNGDDQGNPLSHAHEQKKRWEDENGNKLEQSNLSSSYCSASGCASAEAQLVDSSIDGTTSQYISLQDESRRCSAPPVPKRSPATRLSSRDRSFFPKEDDDYETGQISGSTSSLQLISQNGEHSRSEIAEGKRKAILSVPTPVTSSSSSPVDDNAQISNHLRHGEKIKTEDPCLEFYLVRDGDDEDAADDEVFFSSPGRLESYVNCKKTTCRICGGNLDHSLSVSVPAGSCDTRKFPMDPAKSTRQTEEHLRRMRLDKKFAKVKLLLRTNQVTGLDNPPPSFKPPPPPAHIARKTLTSTAHRIGDSLPDSQPEKFANNKSNSELSSKQRPHVQMSTVAHSSNGSVHPEVKMADAYNVFHSQESINVTKSPSGSLTGEVICEKCDQKKVDKTSNHVGQELNHSSFTQVPTKSRNKDADNRSPSNQNVLPTDVLCKNCINKGWTFRSSEFVSHSPSSLRRPPLGLSYSLEDDLSPGIKEILSPPPKTVDTQNDSVVSSPKSSPVTHMSTFSHSASSLGDGSSQSDLDFSASADSGKVPLTSIKSLTLPTDMKLGPSPFYSDMEGERSTNGTDTKLTVGGLESMRSSSAPPPPQEKGHWKKDKTGLSRKEKQNKNGAADSNNRQGDEEEVTADEKPKKKSVWKSILRRK